VLALLIMLSNTACGIFGGDDLPPMTLERLNGRVEVQRGAEKIEVGEQVSIEPGDVIKTFEDSLAEFSLEGDRTVKLAARTIVRVTSASALKTLQGNLLAETSEPMRVEFGAIEARSQGGAFRIDTGFASARAASLEGVLGLTVAGEPPLSIDPYYEAPVAANDLPGSTRPYRLQPSDVFDQQHLSKWIELDRTLDQLGDGLANQLGRSRPDLDYFSALAGRANVRFMKPYMRRPADELLIGLSIAQNAAGSLPRAFEGAFDLLDQGAVWGIVAAILRADNTRSVLAEIRGAIEATGAVASGQGAEPDFVAAAGDPNPGDGTGGENPPGDKNNGNGGGGGGGGGGDPPDDPEPSPSPSSGCADTVDCTLEGIGVQPSPSPSELVDGG
jgi:hypothetical protein